MAGDGADTEPEAISLSELVARTGVPASTIHYYRRAGLIPLPRREAANRFSYDERHVEALNRIRSQAASDRPAARARLVEAAIEAFQTRSYGEVSVSDIADAAHIAKGTVYRYFEAKEDLFTAAIETLLSDTAQNFAAAVDALGGPAGLANDPEKSALVFGRLVAGALPVLLELGARAAKGHDPSEELARRVLRTLAEAGGRPFAGDEAGPDEAVRAGLRVIETGFNMVLGWAISPGWPPDDDPLDAQLSAILGPGA